ncbi:hypothetical protein B0O99DRAFT_686767 [Bisporella sp. PMI_857]|nr:hypothetical protein B0O99DRAFT_686767 [Bisporella sp. PMI_857]
MVSYLGLNFRIAFFRGIQPRLSRPLSPIETTLIEIIAVAIGLAPFTSGFTSFIPALEFLATEEKNGPTRFSFAQLLLWSIATCGQGIVRPFQKSFYSTRAATLSICHGYRGFNRRPVQELGYYRPAKLSRTNLSTPHPWEIDPNLEFTRLGVGQLPGEKADTRNEVGTDPEFLSDNSDQVLAQDGNGASITVLLYSFAGSALFVSYESSRFLTNIGADTLAESPFLLLPVLRRVPIFGLTAAKDWLWAFDLSPAYIGYGIITGPTINVSILLGAIIGWGILSPVAKHKGWANGPVFGFDNGSRGWILWVGIGLILEDTIIG